MTATREELEENLKSGVYKLIPNPKIYKSNVWQKFSLISNGNGAIFKDWACCNECQLLCRYYCGGTTNLRRHVCYRLAFSSHTERAETNRKNNLNIRQKLQRQITRGECKLVDRPLVGQDNTWKVFACLSQTDGSIVKEWVYCRQCEQVLKAVVVTLKRHRCFLDLKRQQLAPTMSEKWTVEMKTMRQCHTNSKQPSKPAEGNSLDFEMYIIQKNVQNRINLGVYKLEPQRNSTSHIWSKFYFIAKADGSILKGMVYCQQCKMVVKSEDQQEDQQHFHKCLEHEGENRDLRKSALQEAEEGRLDIKINIRAGVYRLMKNSNGRSLIWKIFALITKHDGSIIEDHVYCSKCKKVFKWEKTASLKRHKCFVESDLSIEYDDECQVLQGSLEIIDKAVQHRIKMGVYKLELNQNSRNPIWSKFGFIAMEDGAIMRDMICCRLCREVMKYSEEHGEAILQSHRCFYEALEPWPSDDSADDEATEEYGRYKRLRLDKNIFDLKCVPKNLYHKLKTGLYKLQKHRTSTNPMWLKFGFISKEDDGPALPNLVCCRQCSMVLLYNGKMDINLKQHKCPETRGVVIDQEAFQNPSLSEEEVLSSEEDCHLQISAMEAENSDSNLKSDNDIYSFCVNEELDLAYSFEYEVIMEDEAGLRFQSSGIKNAEFVATNEAAVISKDPSNEEIYISDSDEATGIDNDSSNEEIYISDSEESTENQEDNSKQKMYIPKPFYITKDNAIPESKVQNSSRRVKTCMPDSGRAIPDTNRATGILKVSDKEDNVISETFYINKEIYIPDTNGAAGIQKVLEIQEEIHIPEPFYIKSENDIPDNGSLPRIQKASDEEVVDVPQPFYIKKEIVMPDNNRATNMQKVSGTEPGRFYIKKEIADSNRATEIQKVSDQEIIDMPKPFYIKKEIDDAFGDKDIITHTNIATFTQKNLAEEEINIPQPICIKTEINIPDPERAIESQEVYSKDDVSLIDLPDIKKEIDYTFSNKKELENPDAQEKISMSNPKPCHATAKQPLKLEHREKSLNYFANMIIEDDLPIRTLAGPGFRKILNYCLQLGREYGDELDVNELVPSSATISQRIKQIAERKEI